MEMCHCGEPLHYRDEKTRTLVENIIAARGPTVPVQAAGIIYIVPRHYIALHGIKAAELPTLGFATEGQNGQQSNSS